MAILYFSPRDCWPVDTGARLRDFHLARELARREPLTYLGFERPGATAAGSVQRTQAGPARELDCVLVPPPARFSPQGLLRGLIGPRPISVLNYASDSMRAQLRSLLETQAFDAVQMEGVNLIDYLPILDNASKPPVLIADWHNIESELLRRYAGSSSSLAKRLYARRSAHLLEKIEARILDRADAHIVCSQRERLHLLDRAPHARIQVIGNGVDVDFYGGNSGNPAGQDLVFVGSMDYHANIDAAEYFAQRVLPLLRSEQSGLRFLIVGARPKKQVQALAALPGVVVTGTVEDVRPFYRDAFAVVVPLRIGSGTRLKILEAMAAGVPVISTRLGAEGLEATAGVHYLEAEEPQQFRAAVTRLAGTTEWQRLSSAGLELVRSRYDWRQLGDSLHCFYREVRAEHSALLSSARDRQ